MASYPLITPIHLPPEGEELLDPWLLLEFAERSSSPSGGRWMGVLSPK